MMPLYDIRLEEQSIEQANAVLLSGNLKQGEWTDRFERAFAARFEARHGVAVSSGTAALHLTAQALFEPGDEILVPTFTFFATASSVALAGCVPVFCDVTEDTFTLSVESARTALTSKTRGIILVHLFGHPAPVDEIHAFAEEHDLKVIHDLAQSHGVRWRGSETGGLGMAGCYSLYPTKNLLAGEGGMVTTDDEELAQRIGMLRNHGMDRPYHHPLLGYNYRMTDLESAIALGQLEAFDGQLKSRLHNDRVLREEFSRLEGIVWQRSPAEGEPAPNLLTGRVKGGRRDEVVLALRERGVGCGVYYPSPLHEQEAFAPFRRESAFPVSEILCSEVLSLPVHPLLGEEDLKTIARTVMDIVRS